MRHANRLPARTPKALPTAARAALSGLVGLLLGAFAAMPPLAARAAEADYDADQAPSAASTGRVRYVEGSLRIENPDDQITEDATANMPLFSGDRLLTASRARAEIQLGSGEIVRLDGGARLSLLALPGRADASSEDTILQLSTGTAQIELHQAPPRNVDFRIDTPAASVYLLAAGRYRIDVEDRTGSVTVSTYRGVAEVVGDEGSVILRSGQRTFVDQGGEPDRPRAFNTASLDSFDSWVFDRGDDYLASSSYDSGVDEVDLPSPVRPYRSELSRYGRWVTIAPYGPCWMPHGISVGWRPYYHGYWTYSPRGYFWVSYEPWGWAPYHYGRWFWASGHGWVWTPGWVFSGAWVSWYYGPTYVGWCPLDYWDYPGAYRHGYVDYRGWNFVTYNNIYIRNVHKVYVNHTVVRPEVSRGVGVFVRRPIRLEPRDVRQNRIAPPLIIKKARGQGGDAVITPLADVPLKRSFREKEKAVVRLTPAPRAPGGDQARREIRPRGIYLEDRDRGAVRRDDERTRTDRPSRDARERNVLPRTPAPSSGETDEGRRKVAPGRPRGASGLAPGRSAERIERPSLRGPASRSSERAERSLEDDSRAARPDRDRPGAEPEIRQRPRSAAGEAGQTVRERAERPDRNLREFFRESERRQREPEVREGDRGGRAPARREPDRREAARESQRQPERESQRQPERESQRQPAREAPREPQRAGPRNAPSRQKPEARAPSSGGSERAKQERGGGKGGGGKKKDKDD